MIWSSAQWFVLRRRLRRAGWWIPASGAATAVAGAIASFSLMDPVIGRSYFLLPSLAAAVVVWSLLTGGTLNWLLLQT